MNDYVKISFLSIPFHVKGGAKWQYGPTFMSQRWGHGPGGPPPCGRQWSDRSILEQLVVYLASYGLLMKSDVKISENEQSVPNLFICFFDVIWCIIVKLVLCYQKPCSITYNFPLWPTFKFCNLNFDQPADDKIKILIANPPEIQELVPKNLNLDCSISLIIKQAHIS